MNNEYDYRKDLGCWFGLSYASFLVLPRVLMQDMPEAWQEKMATLLHEYDENFPNQPEIGTLVQATKNGRLAKMPPWLLNYRRPDRFQIAKIRGRVDIAVTESLQLQQSINGSS